MVGKNKSKMVILRKDAELYITQCFEELVNNPDLKSRDETFVTELKNCSDLSRFLKLNLFDKETTNIYEVIEQETPVSERKLIMVIGKPSGEVKISFAEVISPEMNCDELLGLMKNPAVSKITVVTESSELPETLMFEREQDGKIFVKPPELLLKQEMWDELIDSISAAPSVSSIEEIDTGLEIYNKNWHNPDKVLTVSERIYQYDSIKYIVSSGCGVGAPSKTLRENLKKAGIRPPPYPNAAHHIVAVESPKAAASRQILKAYGIALNSPANGVFLPMEKKKNNKKNKYVSTESMHSGGHSDNYHKAVREKLLAKVDFAENRGYTDNQIQQSLCAGLQEIRSDLLTGKLKIHS